MEPEQARETPCIDDCVGDALLEDDAGAPLGSELRHILESKNSVARRRFEFKQPDLAQIKYSREKTLARVRHAVYFLRKVIEHPCRVPIRFCFLQRCGQSFQYICNVPSDPLGATLELSIGERNRADAPLLAQRKKLVGPQPQEAEEVNNNQTPPRQPVHEESESGLAIRSVEIHPVDQFMDSRPEFLRRSPGGMGGIQFPRAIGRWDPVPATLCRQILDFAARNRRNEFGQTPDGRPCFSPELATDPRGSDIRHPERTGITGIEMKRIPSGQPQRELYDGLLQRCVAPAVRPKSHKAQSDNSFWHAGVVCFAKVLQRV